LTRRLAENRTPVRQNRVRIALHALSGGFGLLLALSFALANPLEGVQVYQDIGQGVVISDVIWCLPDK